ncbi:hypothetical protein F0562_005655 [Nyssa sinensis]|uniref:RRM domain-containing protein n=1 Tax=Nyssa sinensis TaxID=561372 RepID=A0A5J5AL62_9ASTE|nr:hypothetical protein F0562_005655 [Nyssa sinensis]
MDQEKKEIVRESLPPVRQWWEKQRLVQLLLWLGKMRIFEAFGTVELVQLPTDPETGHCKDFGFVQAAQSLNGKLEIAGRTIKVSSVTDHVGVQESGAKTADFVDDDGGGLSHSL